MAGDDYDRKRAALAAGPFLAIGLADVGLLLWWGVDPLWGFMILPPILFLSALAWLAFRSGALGEEGIGGAPDEDPDAK